MKLTVHAYDEKDTNTKTIYISSEQGIITEINNINWNFFHQVVLSRSDFNWIEVGGSLLEDGFSSIYYENNKEYVINNPPIEIQDLIDILLSYYRNDNKFKLDFILDREITLTREEKKERRIIEEILQDKFKYRVALQILSIIIIMIVAGYYSLHRHDPLYFSLFVIVFGVIGIYDYFRKLRDEKLMKKIENEKIDSLKGNQKKYKTQLNKENFPSSLQNYINLFEKWGIKNQTLRNELYENSSNDELYELKSIEIIRNELNDYILSQNELFINEKEAVKLTVKAYNDLGLFTWKIKN